MKKNNTTKYKITTGIVSVILGTIFNIKTADAYTSFRNAVIIDKSGVIPDIGINPTTNNNSTIEKNKKTPPSKLEEKKPQGNADTTKSVVGSEKEKSEGNRADVKPEEKKSQGNAVTTKPIVGSEKEKSEGNKADVKSEEKKSQGNAVTTKPVVRSEKEKPEGNKADVKPEEKKPQGNAVGIKPVVEPEKPMDKSTILREIRTLMKIVERELERIIDSSNKIGNQELNKQFLSRDNQASVDNKEKNQETLKANLAGRLVEVSFEKGSISAEKLYVEPLTDSSLIQFISNKLGGQYNVIETFEIHFEKNNIKVDSNIERKVRVAVVKKENYDLEVYHISEDKKLEKIDSNYTEGIITFKKNNFSKFNIVEKINILNK